MRHMLCSTTWAHHSENLPFSHQRIREEPSARSGLIPHCGLVSSCEMFVRALTEASPETFFTEPKHLNNVGRRPTACLQSLAPSVSQQIRLNSSEGHIHPTLLPMMGASHGQAVLLPMVDCSPAVSCDVASACEMGPDICAAHHWHTAHPRCWFELKCVPR